MNQNSKSESGNTFLMIMIGIVLFAALMFTISRGMNENPTTISSRQAKITASDIISYSQQMGRGVARMMQKSCSENDLSVENSYVSGYEHTPAAPDSCMLFKLGGGRISYKDVIDGITEIIFTGANYVEGIGSDCEAVSCTDLVVLFKVNKTICEALNDALSINSIAEEPDTLSTTKFTGDFTYADKITAAAGQSSACIYDTEKGAHFFYSVLYAR